MSESLRILVVTDARFLGGTGSAVATDVVAMAELGHQIDLLFHESLGHFQEGDPKNVNLMGLTERDAISSFRSAAKSYDIVFFHNPQAFQGLKSHYAIETKRAFMIVHHPPFKGDGALCYDPFEVQSVIRKHFTQTPVEWVPVSGLIRAQINSFLPLLRVHPEGWPNVFDPGGFTFQEAVLNGDVLTIGRHGRPHTDKWPDEPGAIIASLPASNKVHVRILGADAAFFDNLGVDVGRWELLPFNSVDVCEFLHSIDVFCYHHSKIWREAFGRTIVEAMLCGRPCVLDPALEHTFGPHAIYCEPRDVAKALDRIRAAPETYLQKAREASDWARSEFSLGRLGERLARLQAQNASRKAIGSREVGYLTALKKYAGFYRRRVRT